MRPHHTTPLSSHWGAYSPHTLASPISINHTLHNPNTTSLTSHLPLDRSLPQVTCVDCELFGFDSPLPG